MGLLSSKENSILSRSNLKENGGKYSGGLKDNMREGKGTYIDFEGHRYVGEWSKNMRHGKGEYYLKNGEYYIGEWVNDQRTGYGSYFYQNGERYIGEWKNNLKEGKGIYYYNDDSYFEGNFHNDKRKGKGFLHKFNGEIEEINCDIIDNEEDTIKEVDETTQQENHVSESKIAYFSRTENNKDHIPSEYEIEIEKSKNINTIESIEEKMQFSEFKSDLKTLDIGLETLSLIDQIEMMNSLNSSLLNKNIQDWTIDEVGEWLNNIGLIDYIEIFKSNHISGKNLLDITDKELKDDLGMFSVGHRKIFSKSQEHLKKIYSKNKIFNQAIRLKLKKFYEKHKNHLRSNLHNGYKFNSIRTSLHLNSEIIEEDQNDQISLKESVVSQKNNENTLAKPRDKNKKFSYENYADDEKDIENDEQPIQQEKELPSALRKNKSKKAQESPKIETTNKETSEFNDINTKNKAHNNPNNLIEPNKISDSDTSSDSSTSSDEEQGKNVANNANIINGNKKRKEKSNESPLELKPSNLLKPPNKQVNRAKRQINSSRYDKNFLVKTLKEKGIGTNFLLDPQELEIQQKIGEGGYGDVYYGKWLGQDVAIKHFGKRYSKFHKKRLADFVKEVEVISNLRHPNILLYMGVCINCPKFDCPNYLMLTEYLEGGSLFDLLHKKHVKLNEDRLILIAEDIALGMNYLHSRRVFHRDLKSSNILVDSSWNIKICDFGLSTVKSKLDRKKFKKEGRIGTPHWMAPEIMRSEIYDEFSDIYSYGMILWEMITGEIPYNGLSVTQIIGSVGYGISQVHIPKTTNNVILNIMEKSLNRDRTKRPTFNQIVEALQNKNRGKEKKRYVINELKKFFDE